VLSGAQVFVPRPCPACGAIARARAEIAGYRLHEILARSGLGAIFRAEDRSGAALAVKLLQPPLAAESTDVEYFASEVWALARLNHPNCLRIFATGVEHGVAWIAMEWLAHGSLAARLRERGRLREAEVLAIGAQAAAALGAAHAAGHPHRDVEPNNLVFADAHTVKLTDFGQAALYQLAADDLGTMWGRAWYVSPERLRNEPEEAYSDIYALGSVLFHALTGTPLHGGEPHGQYTLEMIENGDVRVEETISTLHERTVSVLNRMLASEPAQRFQHWSEVMAQLSQAGTLVARRDAAQTRPPAPAKPAVRSSAAPPPRAKSRRWIWVSAALLALLIAAAFLIGKSRPQISPPVAAAPAPQPIPAPPISPAPNLSVASPPRSPPPRAGSPPSSPSARAR
jgi:serine/threonine protein kinase